MANFFKYMLATIAGIIVTSFLMFLLLIGILSAVASSGNEVVKVAENSLLVLDLEQPIVDRASDDPLEEMVAELSNRLVPIGLNQILSNIEKAKRDDKIKGIVLKSGAVSAGYATVEEIRQALIDFKESGKFVYSFAPVYTQKGYYLASVSNKIYLNPGGMLELVGMYAERTFFKGTLDKLGVEIQVIKHGKFKSAVEPFILKEMSEPARLQTEVYLQAMWNHIKTGIAQARSINYDDIDGFVNKAPLFSDPQLLVDNGYIDGLKYKDEFLSELKVLVGVDEKDDLKAVEGKKYAKVYVKDHAGFTKDKIAVIYAQGGIDDGGTDGIKSEELSKTIRKARRDSSIKAIVFRVNSPGGSALGSDIIWREVELASQSKPLIVSMGDYAASGGYYISCAADKIVANPTTLTGSIGIFGIIPNFEGLTQKVGLSFDGVKTNDFSDMPNVTRPFRKEEKVLLQAYIEKGYDTFIGRCADGRETTKEAIDDVGQGRVWSGINAKEIKLVDEIGGLKQAIELAKDAAGLDNYRKVELPEQEDPIQKLLKGLSGEAKLSIGKLFLGEDFKYIETIESIRNGDQIQARLPCNIEIY